MPTHPRTIHHVLFGQPSAVLQPSGAAEPVDLGGLGFTQSNWTSASATSASILRGSVRKTVVDGRKSWRQLRTLLEGHASDDDDNPELVMGWVHPWVGFGWVRVFKFLVGWVGLGGDLTA